VIPKWDLNVVYCKLRRGELMHSVPMLTKNQSRILLPFVSVMFIFINTLTYKISLEQKLIKVFSFRYRWVPKATATATATCSILSCHQGACELLCSPCGSVQATRCVWIQSLFVMTLCRARQGNMTSTTLHYFMEN
jgi:hypothetical protein